jgi:parallel beta-helix repeat protein
VTTPLTPVPLIGGSLLSDVNGRYKPWGGRTGGSSDPADYDTRLKDADVRSPDAWKFPVMDRVNLRWLDQIHRGTPWQTIYLNAAGASSAAWEKHRGTADSAATHPTNDWRMVDLFLRGAIVSGSIEPAGPVLANNAFVANTALGQGGGIYIVSNSAPTIINNIIAAGSSGVFSCDAVPPAPRNNCVHGNAAYDYSGVPGGQRGFRRADVRQYCRRRLSSAIGLAVCRGR